MEEVTANSPDEAGYPIIQEMTALSAALVACIREQNGVIYHLQEQTLGLFEKTGQLIGQLAASPVFGDLRLATASLEPVFAAVQQTLQQTVSTIQVPSQPSGVYYPRQPATGQGYTPTEALKLVYEATVKDITATMEQCVHQQAQLGELRMQLLVFTKALLVTVLNSLAASAVEQNRTDQAQPSDIPDNGDEAPWTNSQT